jgi:hypothetical protein
MASVSLFNLLFAEPAILFVDEVNLCWQKRGEQFIAWTGLARRAYRT